MPTRSQFETEQEWLEHLRLWFAGQALANPTICTGVAHEYVLRAWFGERTGISKYEIAAAQAGAYADAMLAERTRTESDDG